MVGYLVSMRNDEIPTVPTDNDSLYNMVPLKLVETLERNYSSGFKAVPLSFSARKFTVVEFDVEVLVKFISKTPFHNIVIIKLVPLDLGCDPPKPPRGATITYMQPVVPYFRPSRRPLNYPEYKKDFDSDVCV